MATLALALGACGGRTNGTASGDGGTNGTGDDAGPEPTCTSLGAPVHVTTQDDLNSYPPYAMSGCTLAYVNESGDLVLRDLTTGNEATAVPSSRKARRPTVARDVVAWEETNAQGNPALEVLYQGAVHEVTGPFHHGGEPRAASGVVVFTAFSDASEMGDTDVLLYHADSGALETVAAGPAQQRFADVSATHVAVTDFSEDPDGRYDNDATDLADIVIYDRNARTSFTRKNPGKDAFPRLASPDHLGYLHWSELHPEPKFESFSVHAGPIGGPPNQDRDLADVTSSMRVVQPTAIDGVIEWVSDDAQGASHFYRAAADGSAPLHEVTGLGGALLFAPIAASGVTVLATRAPSGTAATNLRAVAR